MKFPSPRKFLAALFRFAQRPEVVPPRVELIREARCTLCPENENSQCQQCSCFIPLKVKLSTESCPIGKWREYYTPKNNGL
jgi:hypothetical protein